jgi:hypothetical protein
MAVTSNRETYLTFPNPMAANQKETAVTSAYHHQTKITFRGAELDLGKFSSRVGLTRAATIERLQAGETPDQIFDSMFPDEPDVPATDIVRPKTRGDCRNVPRPCPWVSCRYNLFLDVAESGFLIMHHDSPETMPRGCSCALDVADKGGLASSDIGKIVGVTRQLVSQVELSVKNDLRELLSDFKDHTSAERVADGWNYR